MAVDTGTRPGTKPNTRISGSDYHNPQSPEWEKIRVNDRERARFEAGVNGAIASLNKSLIAANVAYVLMHGGHVDKGKLAQSGIDPSWSPARILQHVEDLAPRDLVKSSISS